MWLFSAVASGRTEQTLESTGSAKVRSCQAGIVVRFKENSGCVCCAGVVCPKVSGLARSLCAPLFIVVIYAPF